MKNSLLLLSIFIAGAINAQKATFSGIISDLDGEPLTGATIVVGDGRLYDVADKSGTYSIQGVSEGKRPVEIRFLGYRTIQDTINMKGSDLKKNYTMKFNPITSEEFVVVGTRADISTPMTYQDLDKEQIEANNLGQDLPILLNQTVSTVTTSDAGAGVGYTGLRIRGSDATRINVTINGVPLNDPESHGVFWVNMPDFSSTLESVQIQRGVGTSTNGSAAFGATINMQTSQLDSVAYAEINNSYGSFNTRKHNIILNSGLINDHFAFQGRLSYIGSDGYIDRSASDLRSYYLSGAYYGEKFFVKAITFSGQEVTQQAWYGTPESRIEGDDQAMLAHAEREGYSPEQTANLLNSGRTYNYYLYDNEIDNYGQDHYMLMSNWQISRNWNLNVNGHYTFGEGYFEQFREGDDFASYNLDPLIFGSDTLSNGDFVRRRWLRNHFYGGVYNLEYNPGNWSLTIGGAVNEYDGDHFGELIWAEYASNSDIRENYYNGNSRKLDASQYVKANVRLGNFNLFGDVQARYVDYQTSGTDNDLVAYDVDEQFLFFNPKFGLNWRINSKNEAYISVSRGSREPVRNDFIDAPQNVQPSPEYLTDLELGFKRQTTSYAFGVNGYFMYYEDQLVLTGALNDVGASLRTNVDESYRAGIELYADIDLIAGLYTRPNATFSQNKISNFTEVVYDYTNGFEVIEIDHENTDIAFSPNIIAGNELGYRTKFGLSAAVLSKYVGRQFLDNTSNTDRVLDPYLVNDVRVSYNLQGEKWKNLEFTLLINNIMDTQYSANGYTYSYIFVDQVTENFYYPQAGTNWLLGMKLRI